MPASPSTPSDGRKRRRIPLLADDSTLSDPAFFSSDPADASAETYFEPRRKKQHRGTWWQNGREQRHRKAFERNMDSGVFMGSDSSVESLDAPKLEGFKGDDTFSNDAVRCEHGFRAVVANSVRRRVQVSEPAVVVEARTRITTFVESGDICLHLLDLSDLSLPYLTDDMLAPLRQMVRQPAWQNSSNRVQTNSEEYECDEDERTVLALDSDEDLAEFDGSFDLRLDNNALFTLPSSIFTFTGLKSLSLVNNNLNNLSPKIAGLRDLELLDLTGNRLRWLPGEVIDLVTHRSPTTTFLEVEVAFNPLLQPFSYVGFQKLVEGIDGDEPRRRSVLPYSLKELRYRISLLERPPAENNLPENTFDLQREQNSWLLKVYHHCLANPALVWSRAVLDDDVPLPEEEEQEIINLWGRREGVHGDPDPSFRNAVDNMAAYCRSQVRCKTLLMAATSVSYLDISGKPVDPCVPILTDLPVDQTILQARLVDSIEPRTTKDDAKQACQSPQEASTTFTQMVTQRSHVRSLFALSLTSAANEPELHLLPSLLPDDAPKTVLVGLRHAIQAREEGGRICHACQRQYIIPRAMWVEYHVLNASFADQRYTGSALERLFVPCLRIVCSWGCVPQFEFTEHDA